MNPEPHPIKAVLPLAMGAFYRIELLARMDATGIEPAASPALEHYLARGAFYR